MKRLAGILAVVATLAMTVTPLFAGTAAAAAPGNSHFDGVWQRTDKPVADLVVNRTWIWGPEGRTGLLTEQYAESPGGERTVQYFDKSRMEITHPDGDPNSIWFVTNGLLVVELITGQMQIGDDLFEDRQPAEVPVAGDRNDDDGPTYKTFGGLLDAPATPVGEAYTERLSRSGQRTDDPSLLSRNIVAAHFDEVTEHSIAAPFWDFMNSTGTIYHDGQYIDAALFADPLFGTGRPITEAYWAEVLVAGTPTDVLMQCFERRCLTFNPSNEPGWQVEAGNVGIHYYEWRYETDEDPNQDPPAGDPGDPPGGNPPGDPPPGEPPAGEAPAAPINLSAEALLDGNTPLIVLAWDDQSSNEDGFRIYAGGEGNIRLLADLDADTESYTDYDFVNRNLNGDCYYVEAYNAYGSSARSNDACASVPGTLAPELISPAAGYVSSDRELEFKWTPVEGTTGYVLCILKYEHQDRYCDLNLDSTFGYITWVSGDPAAAGSLSVQLPETLAPDAGITDLFWTVSACAEDAYDCIAADETRRLTIDRRVELTAPALVDEVVDQNDPRRFTFSWELVPGAERYIVCAAEPGANCEHETGNFYKSSILGPAVSSYPLTIPAWLAPDGADTNLNWTAAACDADLNCVWQYNFRSFTVYLEPELELDPPALVSATVDPNDPGRYTFTWDLVPGAERYILCVAEPGASCPNETGGFYKSGILGPAVDTYPLDIPLWLAPEGEATNLNWTVAACDINLNCVWQPSFRSILVDRIPVGDLDPAALAGATVDPNNPARFTFNWNLVAGAERYIVCVAEPGANCRYETGAWYKSSILGPAVSSYPLEIPLWLAPDGQATTLHWTVAACDINLACVWPAGYGTIVVDRT